MMSRSAAPEALLFSGALTSVAKLGSPPARGRRSKAAGLKTVIPAQAKIQVLRTAHKAKKRPAVVRAGIQVFGEKLEETVPI
jgi:hypothetical protein